MSAYHWYKVSSVIQSMVIKENHARDNIGDEQDFYDLLWFCHGIDCEEIVLCGRSFPLALATEHNKERRWLMDV